MTGRPFPDTIQAKPIMKEQETALLQTLCEGNESLTIFVESQGNILVYKSRFIEIRGDLLLLDLPSADSPNTPPLQRNEKISVFFSNGPNRFMFQSITREHSSYRLRETEQPGLLVDLPQELEDGEKREYFRIPLLLPPVLKTRFNVYKRKGTVPVMSALLPERIQEYEYEVLDLSGGGFSIKADNQLEINRGDWINAVFNLPGCEQEMVIWSELRNKRNHPVSHQQILGFLFLENDKNPFLKAQRNRIMRFVFSKQRESINK